MSEDLLQALLAKYPDSSLAAMSSLARRDGGCS
jgi:hypothetical protein